MAAPADLSGHATLGAALFQALRLALETAPAMTTAEVLGAANGANAVATEGFDFVSDERDGIDIDQDGSVRTRVDKRFTSFAEAVWGNLASRIYVGVHWRFDGLPRNPSDNISGVPLGLGDRAAGARAFRHRGVAGGVGLNRAAGQGAVTARRVPTYIAA